MIATGIDIIEVSRIQQAVRRWGQRFLSRVFTPDEVSYCNGQPERLAARFAAKEAAMKALGTGLRGVGWKDIEVMRSPGKAPSLRFHGRALQVTEKLGVTSVAVSISHSQEYAVASVVLLLSDGQQ